MPPIRVLFVCAKNQWRSPTAAAIYQNDARLTVRSAGLSPQSRCVVSAKLLAWADLVMVMENRHAARLCDRFRAEMKLPEIVSLDIPDDFPFMDATLIDLLRSAVEIQLDDWLAS